jgi:hypothetical protein
MFDTTLFLDRHRDLCVQKAAPSALKRHNSHSAHRPVPLNTHYARIGTALLAGRSSKSIVIYFDNHPPLTHFCGMSSIEIFCITYTTYNSAL